MRIGVLDHDVPNLISRHRREHGTDLNLEVTFSPSTEFLNGELRPALGGTFNLQGYTSKLYAYGRWQHNFRSGAFFATGLGAAWNNGETQLVALDRKALGSHVLFHIPFEFGFSFAHGKSVSVYFDHMSNAYLERENEGMDTLGIRFGFRL